MLKEEVGKQWSWFNSVIAVHFLYTPGKFPVPHHATSFNILQLLIGKFNMYYLLSRAHDPKLSIK